MRRDKEKKRTGMYIANGSLQIQDIYLKTIERATQIWARKQTSSSRASEQSAQHVTDEID